MYRVSLFVLCFLVSYSISKPYAEPGFQGGSHRDSNPWQGGGGAGAAGRRSFNGGPGQNSWLNGNSDGSGHNSWLNGNRGIGKNSWSRNGAIDGGFGQQTWPSNSYNTPQNYGYDYAIPGAKVHFAASHGSGGDSLGRSGIGSGDFGSNPWQSQNGFGRSNAWPQQNSKFGSQDAGFGGNSWSAKRSGGGNQWPQKNVNVGW